MAALAVEASRIESTRQLKTLVIIEPPTEVPNAPITLGAGTTSLTLFVGCLLLLAAVVRLVIATIQEHQDWMRSDDPTARNLRRGSRCASVCSPPLGRSVAAPPRPGAAMQSDPLSVWLRTFSAIGDAVLPPVSALPVAASGPAPAAAVAPPTSR